MKDITFTVKGLFVWGICALLYLYGFFLRTVIGTYQIDIMCDLHLNSLQFSLLSSTILLFVYGIMQVPAGIMINMFGLKSISLLSMIVCTGSSFGFAMATSCSMALLSRMFMGFGTSFGFICLLLAVYDWIPHRHSALFIGLSQFIGVLGPMFAAGPLDSLSQAMDIHWRFVFTNLGFIGFALLVLVFLFVENNKKKAGHYVILNRPEKISTSIKKLFWRVQPLYIAILCACLNFTLEYFSVNEGRAFLFLKGVPLNTASYMLTTAWIGFGVGGPLLGSLSDFFNRRKIIMVINSLMGLISTGTILYSANTVLLYIAFFLLGITASCQGIGFALMANQFKRKSVGLGFGLNNAMIMIVPALNAPLLGLLFDYIKKGESISQTEYLLVFNIFIVMYVAAAILSVFFIKETYGKSLVDFTYLNPKQMSE